MNRGMLPIGLPNVKTNHEEQTERRIPHPHLCKYLSVS
jgi:hypothetical protein